MLDKAGWLAVLVAFTVACGSFTYSLIIGASERARVCHLATDIAAIEEGKAKEERPKTEQFERESKDRFGLSQGRFEELVEQTRKTQEDRAHKLSVIAHQSC